MQKAQGFSHPSEISSHEQSVYSKEDLSLNNWVNTDVPSGRSPSVDAISSMLNTATQTLPEVDTATQMPEGGTIGLESTMQTSVLYLNATHTARQCDCFTESGRVSFHEDVPESIDQNSAADVTNEQIMLSDYKNSPPMSSKKRKTFNELTRKMKRLERLSVQKEQAK